MVRVVRLNSTTKRLQRIVQCLPVLRTIKRFSSPLTDTVKCRPHMRPQSSFFEGRGQILPVRKVKCITSGDPPQEPCERCTKKGLTCQYITIAEQDSPDSEGRPDHPSSRSQTLDFVSPQGPSSFAIPRNNNRPSGGSSILRPQTPSSQPVPHANHSFVPGPTQTPWPTSAVNPYTQHSSYGRGNPASPHFVSGSSNLYGSSPTYGRASTPNPGLWSRPREGKFPCTCLAEPCYCGGVRY
ncbi:hypothetical protein R3P38DRAFT_492790 [Favolaschia claudopus]|uniref:Zn(2)-C6 fungal-type domain-containing protein n=1 Tax=Favolaschia claudopus TaxID=2862362 RepID=A0AAW0CNA5_9AGAR